jgi:hypothetical protein
VRSSLAFVIVAIGAFALGVVASTPIRVVALAIVGGKSLQCVGEVCVGDPASAVLAPSFPDEVGGLAQVFCGERRSAPVPVLLRLDHILAGETCETNVMRLHFNDRITETSIEVRGGRVAAIRTYPVHAVTLP